MSPATELYQSSAEGQPTTSNHATSRFAIGWFFVLAYCWTWLCWWTVYATSRDFISLPVADSHLATLGQFGPFAAAIIVAALTSGRAGLHNLLLRLVRWRTRPFYLLVSLLFLPATMILAIIVHMILNGRSLAAFEFRESWSTLPLHFIYLLVLGGALGEEPGWRGFALPQLQVRYGPVVGSTGLGLLHAAWHLPLWWLYPPPCPFPLYVAGVVPMTLIFTWLWNRTHGSVFYSLLFHASLSTASVRLPDVPAYSIWVVILWSLALLLLLYDPHLGYSSLVVSDQEPDS